MADVLLRGNSPLFENDLRLIGHIFFPGGEIAVLAPDEEGNISPDIPEAPWTVTVEARADEEGRLWQVFARTESPAGRQETVLALERGSDAPRLWENRLRRTMRAALVDILSAMRGFRPGWGVLTGVRPTKLVHQLMDTGATPADARAQLLEHYRVMPEKADLVTGIAALQRPFLKQDPRAISLYIGIPYCPSICSFCSFSIYPILEHKQQVPTFLEALGRELEIIGGAIGTWA